MYIGVDLGSTNLKVALYNAELSCVAQKSAPVEYVRQGEFIEFDAEKYYESLITLLRDLTKENPGKVAQIAFTGQAESLVCLNKNGKPLLNAISWMDERSNAECEELEKLFSAEECHKKPGSRRFCPLGRQRRSSGLRKTAGRSFLKLQPICC